MTDMYTVDLKSPEASSPQRCGGKGAALGALTGEAMPVPEGFVVTTDAFRAFLAMQGLSSLYERLQSANNVDQSLALCEALRQRILATDLPPSLRNEVSRKLKEHKNGATTLWAVRSSPTPGEADLSTDIGCYQTELGVRTGEVLDAIRYVWGSTFSEQAARYRRETKSLPVRMAVVVQRLVCPDAAGICFTVDPAWREDTMSVYANYGLGGSVVAGAVIPDTHMVDRDSDQPVMDIMGSKAMQIVALSGGIAETGVPGHKQRQFCLSPTQVGSVAKLAKAVEAWRGKPVRIEWALSRGTLHLLAARPIPARAH